MATTIKLKLKHRPGSGGFKGMTRNKSDDQPRKAVRTGTGKFTGKSIPSKKRSDRPKRQPDGMPQGVCFVKNKKHLIDQCLCGGHYVKNRAKLREVA